jgi:DNA polymerase I
MTRKLPEVKFLLTDLDYHFDEKEKVPILRLFGKRKDKQVLVTIKDFIPYFYVRKHPEVKIILEQEPTISESISKYEEAFLREYFLGDKPIKLYRVYCLDPRKIKGLVKKIQKFGHECYEYDLTYYQRFLIDTTIKSLNVVSVEPTKIEEKGRELFLETSYRAVLPIDNLDVSPDDFYPLKLMSVSVKLPRGKGSYDELFKKKDKRIVAITVMNSTTPQIEKGKVFLLKEDSNDAEKKIIIDFLNYLQEIQPDIIATYRGDTIDFPYLFHRMRVLKIPTYLFSVFKKDSNYYSSGLLGYRMKGRQVYDLALRTWGIHPRSGKKELHDIAEELLGVTNFERIENIEDVWKSAVIDENQEHAKLLVKNCFQDAKLIFDIYWKIGMTGWVETLRVTGYPPFEGNKCTERLNGEFELMRYLKKKDVLIPKRPVGIEVEKNAIERQLHPHEGGTVLYPKGMLHTGVIVVDFRSMYPSVMVAQNIGGETLKQWHDGLDWGDSLKLFRQDTQSALSLMEQELIKKRVAKKEEIKRLKQQLEITTESKDKKKIENKLTTLNREQNSMKIVANAMYGAHFYIRSRFYSQPIAGAISNSARAYLLGFENLLGEVSEKVVPCEMIYGDTDSAFIRLMDPSLIIEIYHETNPLEREIKKKQLLQLIDQMLEILNKSFPKPIELSLKDIAYRCIFKPDRKKAYAYSSIFSDEIEIKGFEAIRSDWSPVSQAGQRKVLEILLTAPVKPFENRYTETSRPRRCHNDPAFNRCEEFLLEFGKKIHNLPFEVLKPHVVTYSPIRRHPLQYKSMPPGVFAFLDYCQKEGLNSDTEWLIYDKFPWIIIPGEGPVFKRARHPKYAEDIDRFFYIRQMLLGIRTFGLETLPEDVVNVQNIGLEAFGTPNTGKGQLDEMPISAYSDDDLNWLAKKKMKKKGKRAPVGQSLLNLYILE